MINTWTIAYRKPRANHFCRVTNWQGTWHQALELSRTFTTANPGLEVWYVPTADAERSDPEDQGNILVETGRRVKIRETGTLPAEIIAQAPDAAAAKARFDARAY